MGSDPLSLVVAVKALDGLSMRMAAIAQNVANAGNPSFQSVAVEFERALAEAARRGVTAVEHMPITFEAGEVLNEGDDRRLDLQLADAARTAGRYAALTDMIGQRMALASLAIGSSR